jgi:hypothetical protein
MDDFARACCSPRRVTLGGREFLVSKLSPRDFGDLQAWCADQLVSPLEAARDAMAGLPDREARDLWAKALAEAKSSWPPDLGSETGGLLLASPEGFAHLLWVALRRHHPRVTRARARRIAAGVTDAERARLYERVMPGELGDFVDPDASGDTVPYEQARAELCEQFGWAPDRVDAMPFDVLHSVRSGGRRAAGIPVQSEDDARRHAGRWRDYFLGLPPAPPGPEPETPEAADDPPL